jgi:hypothetical protein
MAMGTGSQSSSFREMSTFYLAMIVIGLFFIFYGITLFVGVSSSPPSYSGVEIVAATLGPIAATVVGYYFGQRPVESLTGQVREGAVREERAKAGFGSSYEQIGIDNDQIQDLMDQLRTKERIIERLVREIGER